MCVKWKIPLTSVENDAFRAICQKCIDVGREFTLHLRNETLNVVVLPSYAESHAFVNNTMISARDALIAEAHAIAVSGGTASIYGDTLIKSYNLVLTSLHFITTDWLLKTVPIAPIEIPASDGGDDGVYIKKRLVLSAVGVAPSSAAAKIFPPNGIKTECNEEIAPKCFKKNGDKADHVNSSATVNSINNTMIQCATVNETYTSSRTTFWQLLQRFIL